MYTNHGFALNADSVFDAQVMREVCFRRDSEANITHNPRSAPSATVADHYFNTGLYRQRTAIERTNAWLDSCKTLLVGYEINVQNWLAFRFLAFTILLIHKIPPNEKP